MNSGELGRSPLGDLQLGRPSDLDAPAPGPVDQVTGQLGNPLATLGRFQFGTPPPVAVAGPPTVTGVGQVVAPPGYGTGHGYVVDQPPVPIGQLPAPVGGVVGRGEFRRIPEPVVARGRVVAPIGHASGAAVVSTVPAVYGVGQVVAPLGGATGAASATPPPPIAASVRARGHPARPRGRARVWVGYRGRGGVRSARGGASGAGVAFGPWAGAGAASGGVGAARGTGSVTTGGETEALWLIGLGEFADEGDLLLV